MLSSDNKKALLVDTGFSAGPILETIARMHWNISVAGNRPGDKLAQCADSYLQIDYSSTADLLEAFKHSAYNALVPGCTDASYLSCSRIAHINGVRGIDQPEKTRQLFDKALFRKLCKRLHLPTPQVYTKAEDIPKGQPVIVKPVDSFSGKGIELIEKPSRAELERAIYKSSKHSGSSTSIVEEFVSGQLYSTSAFIRRGKIIASFLVEEFCQSGSFSVSLSRVVDESVGRSKNAVENAIESIAQQLELEDGLMHLQWIDGETSFWLIEMTRRCPGDLYAKLIEKSTGFDYATTYVAPFLGSDLPEEKEASKANPRVCRLTALAPPGEIFLRLNLNPNLKEDECHILLSPGETIPESGRVAVLFIEPDATLLASPFGDQWHTSVYNIESSNLADSPVC